MLKLHDILMSLFTNLQEDTGCLTDSQLISSFISSKRVEGCSEKTLKYYSCTLKTVLCNLSKSVKDVNTNDIRNYLADYHESHSVSKVTIDNVRRILSSFFSS